MFQQARAMNPESAKDENVYLVSPMLEEVVGDGDT